MDCDIYAIVYIVFYYFSATTRNTKINISKNKKEEGCNNYDKRGN